MKKLKAFTLIELLLALGIVGTLAVLTAPSIMDNVNKKVLTNQLKNFTHDVTFLIDEQLLNNNTKMLINTDFATPSEFFTHFEISKTCDPNDQTDCWAPSYKKLSDMSVADVSMPANSQSVKLKNGAVINYTFGTVDLNPTLKSDWEYKYNDDIGKTNFMSFRLLPTFAALSTTNPPSPPSAINPTHSDQAEQYKWTGATILIDINGPDQPNIVGRDLFEVTVSNSGQFPKANSLAALKTSCQKGDPASCFAYVMGNGWDMDY